MTGDAKTTPFEIGKPVGACNYLKMSPVRFEDKDVMIVEMFIDGVLVGRVEYNPTQFMGFMQLTFDSFNNLQELIKDRAQGQPQPQIVRQQSEQHADGCECPTCWDYFGK